MTDIKIKMICSTCKAFTDISDILVQEDKIEYFCEKCKHSIAHIGIQRL